MRRSKLLKALVPCVIALEQARGIRAAGLRLCARTSLSLKTEVKEGQTLVILEAMKMEYPVTAPHAGKVCEACAARRCAVDTLQSTRNQQCCPRRTSRRIRSSG